MDLGHDARLKNVYIRKTFLNFHFDPNLLLHQHCDQVTKWSFPLQKSASFKNFCFIFSLNLNRKDFNLNLVCNLKSTESNNFIASWSIASVALARLRKKIYIFIGCNLKNLLIWNSMQATILLRSQITSASRTSSCSANKNCRKNDAFLLVEFGCTSRGHSSALPIPWWSLS